MAAADAAMASLISLVPAEWLNEALKVFESNFKWKSDRRPKSLNKRIVLLTKDAESRYNYKRLTLLFESAWSGLNVTMLTDTAEDVMKVFKDRVLDKSHGEMVMEWIESSWFQVQKNERHFRKAKYVFALFSKRIILVKFLIEMKTPNRLELKVKTCAERSDKTLRSEEFFYIYFTIEGWARSIARRMFTDDEETAFRNETLKLNEREKEQLRLDFAEKNLPVYQQIKWRSLLQPDKALAAMMATQPRLGAKSPLHHLDDMLLKNIVRSTLQEIDTKTLVEFLNTFFREGYEQALQRFQMQAQLPDVCAACGRLVLQ